MRGPQGRGTRVKYRKLGVDSCQNVISLVQHGVNIREVIVVVLPTRERPYQNDDCDTVPGRRSGFMFKFLTALRLQVYHDTACLALLRLFDLPTNCGLPSPQSPCAVPGDSDANSILTNHKSHQYNSQYIDSNRHRRTYEFQSTKTWFNLLMW